MRESLKPLLWSGFLLCLLGHVWLGAALGLSVDEAHYALYAANPALSYFDHPPLVGWLQVPFVYLHDAFALGDWVLRVVPLLLWALTLGLLVRVTAPSASFWAALLFLVSPLLHLLGFALVPDSILVPLTLWVMLLTQGLYADISAKRHWLCLGVALGLAGLAKFSAVFMALGVALVLLPRHKVALFKQGWMWAAILIALLLIAPVLIWNAQNDWVAFTYQAAHAQGRESWSPWNSVRFDLVQLLVYGVLLFVGVLAALCARPHRFAYWHSLAFSLPLLCFAAYAAGKNTALPHWTAPAWIALMPLAALGLASLWQGARKWLKVSLMGMGALQALSTLALSGLMLLGGASLVKSGTGNPFADLHGWREAGQLARELHIEHKTQTLAVANWTLASRLAWYARAPHSQPAIWAIDGKNKQFELWWPDAKAAHRVLFVNWSQKLFGEPSGFQCQNVRELMTAYSSFHYFVCTRE